MSDIGKIVNAIQGNPVKREILNLSQTDYVLTWDGYQWKSNSITEFTAGGDLTGSSTNQKVISLLDGNIELSVFSTYGVQLHTDRGYEGGANLQFYNSNDQSQTSIRSTWNDIADSNSSIAWITSQNAHNEASTNLYATTNIDGIQSNTSLNLYNTGKGASYIQFAGALQNINQCIGNSSYTINSRSFAYVNPQAPTDDGIINIDTSVSATTIQLTENPFYIYTISDTTGNAENNNITILNPDTSVAAVINTNFGSITLMWSLNNISNLNSGKYIITSNTSVQSNQFSTNTKFTLATSGTTTLSASDTKYSIIYCGAAISLTGNIIIDFDGTLGLYYLDFFGITIGANTVVVQNTSSFTFDATALLSSKSLLTINCGNSITGTIMSVG